MSNTPTKRPWFSMILLTLILVILPLGSYLFMKKGYNYRLGRIQSMDNLGPWPAFSAIDKVTGMTFTPDSFSNKNALIAFPTSDQDSLWPVMELVHEQFEARKDVFMVFFTDSAYTTLPMRDSMRILHLPVSNLTALKTAFKVPSERNNMLSYIHYLGQIQATGSATNKDDMRRIVEYLALFLPKTKKDAVTIVHDKH
jgi:hypothetical protein